MSTEELVYNGSSLKKGSITMVLVGMAGSGKSATGNTILEDQRFISQRSFVPTTKETDWGTKTGENDIMVIDTPPLPLGNVSANSAELTPQNAAREIGKCIEIAATESSGLDAIVLTLNISDRFTHEHNTSIRELQQIFGRDFHRYLIVLFTRKDQLAHEGISLEEYLRNTPEFLRSLLYKCDNRVVAFDNKTTDDAVKSQQTQSLVKLINEMKANNKHIAYSIESTQSDCACLFSCLKCLTSCFACCCCCCCERCSS